MCTSVIKLSALRKEIAIMPEFVPNQDGPGAIKNEAPGGAVKEGLQELEKGMPKAMINKLDDPVKIAAQLSKDPHIDAGLVMTLGHMDSEKAEKLVKGINSELAKTDAKLKEQGKPASGLKLDYSDTVRIVDFSKDQGHYRESTLTLSKNGKVVDTVKPIDQYEDRQRRQATQQLKSSGK